jgi:hypothetical protein
MLIVASHAFVISSSTKKVAAQPGIGPAGAPENVITTGAGDHYDAPYRKCKTSILLIEEKDDGIFLYEFRADGFVGDTWHPNIDEAKEQATHYFGSCISAWQEVPPEVVDPVAFGRSIQN